MKKFNKKGIIPLLVIVLIGVLITSLLITGVIDTASLLGYSEVYKQNWGSMCCIQKDNYDVIITKTAKQQYSWRCEYVYTNECDISIKSTNTGLFSDPGIKFRKCDSQGNCGAWTLLNLGKSEERVLTPLNYREIYQFEKHFLANELEDFTITLKAKSFYIKGMENGKIYQQESCILNSDLKKRILSDGVNQLLFDECQNYMIDFVAVASKTYSYNGQEVICQARNLYSINNEQFKDGLVKKIQGNKIKAVECCPSESNCDENKFEFVEENIRECSYNSQCSNGGDPIPVSGNSYVTFNCINGKCVQSAEKQTECTNNAICIQKNGPGSVCDLSALNYGKCKGATEVPDYCGDGYCSSVSGETSLSCPADCGKYVDEGGLPWWGWFVLAIALLIALYFLWPGIYGYLMAVVSWLKANPLIVVAVILAVLLFGGVIFL